MKKKMIFAASLMRFKADLNTQVTPFTGATVDDFAIEISPSLFHSFFNISYAALILDCTDSALVAKKLGGSPVVRK